MGTFHDRRFPGETAAYRAARDALLAAEAALREQTEAVAALRRALPPGGALLRRPRARPAHARRGQPAQL